MSWRKILKELTPNQENEIDLNNNGEIDAEDFAMLREDGLKKEIKTFEKDKNEAASAASLSDLRSQLKDAPKYIKTALNEIERYLKGE